METQQYQDEYRQAKTFSFGEIRLWIGPMFSEKTTELIRTVRRYSRAGMTTIILKYKKDDQRYGVGCRTHSGISMRATSVDSLLPHLDLVRDHQVVAIDEGQFFSDLVLFCRELVTMGKIVIVAALDGTFERKPFQTIVDLIPLCKKIYKLSAICSCCGEEAAFTRRLTQQKEMEIIGSSELYQAACESCYRMDLTLYLEEIEKRRLQTSVEESWSTV